MASEKIIEPVAGQVAPQQKRRLHRLFAIFFQHSPDEPWADRGRPGGAGKSTLLGAILGLLPPDVQIVTVDGSDVIQQGLAQPADEQACYLAHEIGSGQWYGYIWGQDVADFFSLVAGRRRIASCLHADTLAELTGILRSPPLRVREAALEREHVGPTWVADFEEIDDDEARELRKRDAYERVAGLLARLGIS